MATTPEDSKQDQDDFAAAFAGADPVKTEMSEDEAFGLTADTAEADEGDEPEMIEAEEDGETDGADQAQSASAGGDMVGTDPAIVIAIEPGAEDNAGAEDEPTDPKELQRQKSWEGRLKAREAELKAREEALSQGAPAATEMSMEAGEAGESEMSEAVEEAAEKVESGELTFDQAMATLSNDFGPDFTRMLGVLIEAKAGEIAGKAADERVSKVSSQIDGLVGEIVDDKARSHFESISDAHPDFMDVAESPEFKDYVDGMDETQRAAALQTIESGSARNIIKLLSTYKDSKSGGKLDPAQESSMDAAEGVRSGGLKLPEKPSISEDYADAWDKF